MKTSCVDYCSGVRSDNFIKDQLPTNYCTNQTKFKSKKDLLLEFAKGPCNPVLIIPGIMSTNLMVEIDCKVL